MRREKPFYSVALYSYVFLLLSAMPVNTAQSQNANERDIQLPRPVNSELPSIFIIGDSTVRNGTGDGANGQWGWGSFLHTWFDAQKVNVVNRAIGGRSSRTYTTQGYWEQQKELLKPGDVMLVQFGHNDASPVNDTSRARGVLDGIGNEQRDIFNKLTKREETVRTYGAYLRNYISDIRGQGGVPIICSPVPTHSEVISKLDDCAKWAEQVSMAEGVAFLDLNEIIDRAYEKVGEAKKEEFFSDDRVHTTWAGAKFSANMVVAALKELKENPVSTWFSEKADVVSGYTGQVELSSRPVVAGYGKGLFEVGELLYQSGW